MIELLAPSHKFLPGVVPPARDMPPRGRGLLSLGAIPALAPTEGVSHSVEPLDQLHRETSVSGLHIGALVQRQSSVVVRAIDLRIAEVHGAPHGD